MARFRFATTWELNAPLPAVWDAIQNSAQWPQWWRGVLSVEDLEPGDAHGIGKVQRFVWKSRLPYAVRFTMRVCSVDYQSRIEGVANGEVEGIGVWRFTMHGNNTIVRYQWEVRTIPLWVNLIAPFARRLIRWNHDQIMNWGAVGLAQLLRAPLIRSENDSA